MCNHIHSIALASLQYDHHFHWIRIPHQMHETLCLVESWICHWLDCQGQSILDMMRHRCTFHLYFPKSISVNLSYNSVKNNQNATHSKTVDFSSKSIFHFCNTWLYRIEFSWGFNFIWSCIFKQGCNAFFQLFEFSFLSKTHDSCSINYAAFLWHNRKAKWKHPLVTFWLIEESKLTTDESSFPNLLDWIKSERPKYSFGHSSPYYSLGFVPSYVLNSPVNSIFTAPTLFVSSFSSFASFSSALTRSLTLVTSINKKLTSDYYGFQNGRILTSILTFVKVTSMQFSKPNSQALSSQRLILIPDFLLSMTLISTIFLWLSILLAYKLVVYPYYKPWL